MCSCTSDRCVFCLPNWICVNSSHPAARVVQSFTLGGLADSMPPELKALAMDGNQHNFEKHGFRACIQRALGLEERKDKKRSRSHGGSRNDIRDFRLGQQASPPRPPLPSAQPIATSVARLVCVSCRNLQSRPTRQLAVPKIVCSSSPR